MSLVKRTYVDQETVITAENLNAIQDAIIENEEAIEDQGEAIEGKYSKPAGGIPATDMASGVQTSLGKADSAYQKPSGGIPASDMASAVQTSLGKAESAYQKPSGGIPASDMASGVQTSLGKAESAYQKPSGGIPASDMASGVQTSLGKADSAYQKPSGGIPASDMASGVQTSLGKADSAYQKPSGGIPATDMASGVQTSLGKADSALQSSDIDSTLTVAGKAADAKKTGDEISDVKNTLDSSSKQAVIDAIPVFSTDDWEIGSIDSYGNVGSIYTIRTKHYYLVRECSIKFTGVLADANNRYCYPAFYDANHNWLYRFTGDWTDWYTPWAVDGEVVYVRFIYGWPSASGQTVESYGFSNLASEFSMQIRNGKIACIENNINFIQDGVQDQEFSFIPRKYIAYATGEAITNSNYHATDYIKVQQYTNYIDTNCKGSNAGTDGYAFYDKNKTFITNSGGHLIRYGNTRILVPNGAAYIRLSSRMSYEETGISRYVKCVSHTAQKPNVGYTVVMLGDSLIGNYDSESSVPHYLEDFSGAICHNCAFGGSNLGTDTVGSINQLLLPFRGFKVIEAIVNNDYTEMEAAISADPDFETLINYYPYHVAKLKGMDWSKVDVITMSWGTNDWGTSVTLENNDNLMDTNTVAGALRTALQTLWSTYPHIKVMICGPVWRGGTITDGELNWDSDNHPNSIGLYLEQYSEIEEKVAKEYHVPFIEMYNHTNFNRYTWKNYFPVGGTNATHPNANGRYVMARRYAQHIAEI